jgi:two-component system CheB/CheR fusion protein
MATTPPADTEATAHAGPANSPESAAADPRPASEPGAALPGQAAVFPIVGIGASAGGLAAFEAFFAGMPAVADPGMAFVLVQHLAPDHKSLLTELIGRCTRMQVFEVEDGMAVAPDCVHVIPPNKDLSLLHGRLRLLEPFAPRGLRRCQSPGAGGPAAFGWRSRGA